MSIEKIKLVIFDLSNVCFSLEEPPYIHDFCLKHNLDEKEFDDLYQEFLKKAEVGEMSGQEVWRIMLEKYKIGLNPIEIIKEMMDRKYEHQDVLDIVKKIKDTNLPVVYLTNYNEDYWKFIADRWDMSQYFSSGLVSYEIGARKPAPSGFLKLMDIYKAKPEQTLFIDDMEGNLTKAKEVGIKGHLFTGTKELIEFLKEENIL